MRRTSALSCLFTLLVAVVLTACFQGALHAHAARLQRLPANLVDDEELWLADHEGNGMQSDDPSPGGRSFTCPPPPASQRSQNCRQPRCSNDRQCPGPTERCCNNGCVFTCMAAMKPPVVVDWVREPRGRLTSGRSWLVPGPERTGRDEPCSTSIFTPDEAPLLCPDGYICHIDYFGDPQKNIPNRGRCIKDHPQEHDFGEEKPEMTSRKGVCMFNKRVFPDKSKFIYNHHVCTCQQGAITCKVNTELQDTYST